MAQKYTSGFKDKLVTSFKSEIDTNFTYLGYGTGTTNPTSSDTALATAIGVRTARQELTTGASSSTAGFFLPSTTANGNTITEIGVFDASTGGSMQLRATLDVPITKTSDVELWSDIANSITITDNS